MKKLKVTLALFCATVVFYSCDKAEEVAPSIKFSQVNAILTANCQPCHVAGSGASFDARAKFVNNSTIAKSVASGIISRISRNPGEAGFMPRNGTTKLSTENIKTIQDWIDGGFAEN